MRAQAGVVGRRQLIAAHVSASTVRSRLRRQVLAQQFYGVYGAGHEHLTRQGHRTAVVLAGTGSILHAGTATELHGFGGGGATWRVVVPGPGGRRTTQGIEVSSSTTLAPHDVTVVSGLPVTSVARSIVDAAQHVSRSQMATLLARADRAALLDLGSIEEVMGRVRHRPGRGHAVLTDALFEYGRLGAQLSRSDVEAALHHIATRAGLAAPLLNRNVAGDEVDAIWPAYHLAIEIDSWEFHRDRRSFVADRATQRRLTLAGWTVLAFAAADVVHRPALVAAQISAVARARRPGDRHFPAT